MMNNNMNNIEKIPQEKFEFVQLDARLTDKKLDTKARGFFADAMLRFSKNKSSVIAAWILLFLIVYSIMAPIISPYSVHHEDTVYAKMPAYISSIADLKLGILDGGQMRTGMDQVDLDQMYAIEQELSRGWNNGEYQDYTGKVVLKTEETTKLKPNRGKFVEVPAWNFEVNTYRAVGIVYRSMTPSEFEALQAWQDETGIQVIYPAVDPKVTKEFSGLKSKEANVWYKLERDGNTPVKGDDGMIVAAYCTQQELAGAEYNSLRIKGDDGSYIYSISKSNGNALQVRVSYYHYYQYVNGGMEPTYLMGTSSDGKDLFCAIGAGARFSLIFAVVVSAINMFLGAVYGAIQGYYGGWIDMLLDRISDVLSGVPFVVVTTLFQLHLAQKVGVLPSFLFAFVLTGWIGMAALVRKQFYRFKSLEFVMAARTLGASDTRLMFKHIFPNALGTIVTSCAMIIPGTIGSETQMTYLGIINLRDYVGVTIGTLLSSGQASMVNAVHAMFWPSLFFALLMISFNLFGNGLRDAFNPSTRGADD